MKYRRIVNIDIRPQPYFCFPINYILREYWQYVCISCICSMNINIYRSKFAVFPLILYYRPVLQWKTATETSFFYYSIMSNICLFRIFDNFDMWYWGCSGIWDLRQSFCYSFFPFAFMNSAIFIWCCKKATPFDEK